MDGYDVAQICLNGHVINGSYIEYSEFNTKFCKECGAGTIIECPSCHEKIQGEYHSDGIISLASHYQAPKHCHECGASFPWTESRLKAAIALAEEEKSFSEEDKKVFAESLPDITSQTPKTPVAVSKLTKLIKKAGNSFSSVLKDIFVNIASETIRKQLWP